MADDQRSTGHLDVLRDLNHPSYKLVGFLAWVVLVLGLVGTFAFPSLFLAGVRLFAFYLLTRLMVGTVFYVVGIVRCRIWERRADPGDRPERSARGRDSDIDVHHVVLVPNYKEPVEILARTLDALATQKDARHRLTVVLAMEEREVGARAKARALRERYADRFARLLITLHPANLPGEIPCKGSNQTWAARRARQELVDRLGIPIEHLTLTSCDADSVLHPRYFAELGHRFAGEPDRYLRFWFAPVFYYNNVWKVPIPIRLLSFSTSAARLGELANPLSWPLPISTYTLSFKLADEVGYWDPVVISEDWHMYLRCFFATDGRIRLSPVYLPTTVDAVDGGTLGEALANYYRQQVRHAWGAEDVGYILQQWRRSPGTPIHKKLLCFFWVFHHHLLRSTSWFLVALGSVLSGVSRGVLASVVDGQPVRPDLIWFFNIAGAVTSVAIWAVERARCAPRREGRALPTLAREVAVWVLMFFFCIAFALPGLHAQTKLLLGRPLEFRRTPKRYHGEGSAVERAAARR